MSNTSPPASAPNASKLTTELVSVGQHDAKPAHRSALDDLSDRDLLYAGLWALERVNSGGLLAVTRAMLNGTHDFASPDQEHVIAAGVAVASGNAGTQIIPHSITPDNRRRIVEAFADLGVGHGEILAAAAEIEETPL